MNKNIKAILLTVLLVLVFVFYWFEYRPSQIRKACIQEIYDEMKYSVGEAERERLGWDMNKINAMEREKAEHWYKECLHERGLAN